VSLRTRLVLAAAYLLTAVVVSLEVPLALNVDRRADSEFQSGVLGNAAILAARSADLVAGADTATAARRRTPARLRTLVAGSTRTESERIVVTDVDGEVLVDSERLAVPGTPYATAERPEFAVALFQGRIDFRRRRSESLGEALLLVTVPVVDRQRVVGAIRVSAPTGAVEESVRESWLRLGLIGLVVIVAGLGLAWILAGSLARPLERLRTAASALGRGDLDARAPDEGPRELRAVADTFNEMARTLTANLSAQRDFLANASHQLRTPLTGLKLRLEALEAEPEPVGGQGGGRGRPPRRARRRLARARARLVGRRHGPGRRPLKHSPRGSRPLERACGEGGKGRQAGTSGRGFRLGRLRRPRPHPR
jgi:two-component system, OmpR family, sensor kinase